MQSPDRSRPLSAAWFRAMLPVLLLAVAARVELQLILPAYAYSYDISAHEEFARVIGSGQNPYATTPFYLAWPPLWGFCVYALARIADLASAPFIDVLRLFLVVVDMIVILVAAAVMSRATSLDRARRVVLFGIALNPILVLLTVQHGNFDSIVVTWVMAAILALAAWRRSGDPADWLLGCLFLGLGVFTKTVPLALAPLLLPGARVVSNRMRLIGTALFVGPTAVGLGAFFILQPSVIIERVLLYRSVPGRFGVSGLLRGLDMANVAVAVEKTSTLFLLLALVWGCTKAWSWAGSNEHRLALLAGLILLAIPTIGPGFAPQYAYWFVPLLALTWTAGSRNWKLVLATTYAMTAATYVVLYGFAWDLGQSIFFLWDSPFSRWLGAALRHDAPRTWVTFPMYLSWLVLLAAGVKELRSGQGEEGDIAS